MTVAPGARRWLWPTGRSSRWCATNTERPVDLGRQAVAFATEAGDQRTLSNALNNVGTSLRGTSNDGEPELRTSIELALSIGDADTACRGYVNLSWVFVTRHAITAAEAVAAEGLALAVEAEHQTYETHLTAILSRIAMANCEWRRAADLAATVPATAHASRGVTLVVQALVAARTASESPFEMVQGAWLVAERADELQRRGPVAAAALEASYLTGSVPPIPRTVSVYREAERLGDRWLQAELAYRLRAAGHPRPDDELDRLQEQTDSPFAVQAAVEWQEAADRWRALGRAYEEAQALAEAPDEATRLRALEMLDQLGAVGLAQQYANSSATRAPPPCRGGRWPARVATRAGSPIVSWPCSRWSPTASQTPRSPTGWSCHDAPSTPMSPSCWPSSR